MTLLEEIACFERQFHCCLAFHDRTGELTALAGGKLALHHANRICEKVRSADASSYRRCVADDTREGAGACRVKRCHAGYYELVLPIRKFSLTVGTMFVGIFESEAELSEELRFFSRLFAESIERRLERSVEENGSGSLRDRIEIWFLHHFRNPEVSREDLASALHLSVSRVSQILRRSYGESFPEHLRKLRVQCAAQILTHSRLPVTEAARLSGFRSANYLHRVFLSVFGCTPQEYRRARSGSEEE